MFLFDAKKIQATDNPMAGPLKKKQRVKSIEQGAKKKESGN